ncbi:MAG: ribonuclease P protein component [Gemmatimonadetes bacterium]|nr:ribonuclease P protein component [Gemmatimonadota bacterium]NIR79148.1 ribonuclease P protein component [Gemmatimonadota bacterium]NIT87801.1 ribonuclease P protein component [Gemmatimonadota bacterium]NIU31664.1 ribonuclease P protein component [Gemmatimonadota bacterium]NIU36286.1 ribonuclease P protein component [Gemmatimonadota bacterium]
MTGARPGRPGAPGGCRFPPRRRITKAGEIRRTLRRGKRERTSHLDVFDAASPVSHSRLGVIVPTHGRRIVERNRLKRRLREIGRVEVLPRLDEAGASRDVLVRARGEAYGAAFDELRSELIDWTQRRCSPESSSD